MKKLLIILSTGMILIACEMRKEKSAGEQTSNALQDSLKSKAIEDSANFTSIQWLDSTDLDLGTVKEGAVVDVSYRFKNTGDKPLIISRVTAGCGCTIPETPQEPFQPGEEGQIKAKFNSEGRQGMNDKTVNVLANTKGTTSHILQFHVKVEKANN